MRKTYAIIVAIIAFTLASPSYADTINFTRFMPDEFEYCGEKLGRDSEQYKALFNWFSNNTTGWYRTTTTFPPERVFTSKSFNINFIDNRIIVGWVPGGSPNQHVRPAKTAGLAKPCP